MKVACHQPNFLPPLSFFAKWKAADVMVLLDDVQFTTNSARDHYANRCKLGDDKWCTIPVKKRFPQNIKDVMVADNWKSVSLVDRVKGGYRNAEYMPQVVIDLATQLAVWSVDRAMRQGSLCDLNILLLATMAHELGIDTPYLRQSALNIGNFTDPDARLIRCVQEVGGDTYLSGPKGPNYMSKGIYDYYGIEVEICRYEPIKYSRGERPWVPYMSVVDALCYHGKEAGNFLELRTERWL